MIYNKIYNTLWIKILAFLNLFLPWARQRANFVTLKKGGSIWYLFYDNSGSIVSFFPWLFSSIIIYFAFAFTLHYLFFTFPLSFSFIIQKPSELY